MIGVDIYHYTTDMPTLIPFIRKVQQDYHGVIQNVVADSGYASEKNYDFLERNSLPIQEDEKVQARHRETPEHGL